MLCGRNETLTNWLREKFPGRAKMEYNPWCLSIREVDTLSRLLPKLKLVAKAQTDDLEPASVLPTNSAIAASRQRKNTGRWLNFCDRTAAKPV